MFITEVIWFYDLFSILSIPDEGYSRNVSCPLNLISPFSLDIRINFEIPQMLIEPIVFLCDFSQNET